MELLPLVCLCLLSCSGDAVRVVVEEGSDAVLPCLISTKENLEGKLFDWRKDGTPTKKEVFIYEAGRHYNNGLPGQDQQFKGRVSFFQDQLENGNASIKITRTKMADSGTYSCDFPRLEPRQTFNIELVVAVRVVVKQDSDAVLPCLISTKENLEGKRFDWRKDDWSVFLYEAGNHYNNGLRGQDEQFKGRVSFFQDQLQNGNASIKIQNTKMADSGTYSCIFPNLQSPTSIIELVVDPVLKDRTGENIPGAAPEPSVKILDQTKDWSRLQCVVKGASPKPKVEWKNSYGNILPADEPEVVERGGRFYIALNITVTKTDRYYCVVTQEDIGHQTDAETYVHINGSNTGLVATIVVLILLLVVVAVPAGLYFKNRKQNRTECSRRNTTNGPTDTELTSTMI